MKQLSKENGQHSEPVSRSEYNQEWINETWGWDDAREFVRSGGLNIRPRVAKALEMARMEKGMKVLDVGCGRGEVVLHCARRGIVSVGIDYSPDAIDLAEKARANVPDEVVALSTFLLGDINDMDESLGPFDRVFLLDIVEHLHDYELIGLFRKLQTLLSPGGYLVIHTLPNKWVYDLTYSKFLWFFMPWLPRNPRSEKEQAIHVNEMTITHLDQLLEFCDMDHRIYLKEAVTSQAEWHKRSTLEGSRSSIYRLFQNTLVKGVYRIMALTPFRLLIVNDIFCLARSRSSTGRLPRWHGLSERMACYLGRKFRPRDFTKFTISPPWDGTT